VNCRVLQRQFTGSARFLAAGVRINRAFWVWATGWNRRFATRLQATSFLAITKDPEFGALRTRGRRRIDRIHHDNQHFLMGSIAQSAGPA
jgi:hypothetical protein